MVRLRTLKRHVPEAKKLLDVSQGGGGLLWYQRPCPFLFLLALQKQLTKTLAARFLPGLLPTTTAAICSLPGPLTLQPAATAAATLFPAPVLGPALFRSPAEAIRPAAGPILFAPY